MAASIRGGVCASIDRKVEFPSSIGNIIIMLHENETDSPYRRFMPPMAGTRQDIDDLANFLKAQANLGATVEAKMARKQHPALSIYAPSSMWYTGDVGLRAIAKRRGGFLVHDSASRKCS